MGRLNKPYNVHYTKPFIDNPSELSPRKGPKDCVCGVRGRREDESSTGGARRGRQAPHESVTRGTDAMQTLHGYQPEVRQAPDREGGFRGRGGSRGRFISRGLVAAGLAK